MQEPLKNQSVGPDEVDATNSLEDTGAAPDRLQELETQVKEKENKYLYLYAEFENHKKRAIKERSDLIKFGWENVARDLLESLDNLDRAIEHAPKVSDPGFAQWFAGVQMVATHFRATMERQGIRVIEAVGKDFDANFHEAMGFENSNLASGKVVRELVKGYTLHGRLLRPAKVSVSNGTPAT